MRKKLKLIIIALVLVLTTYLIINKELKGDKDLDSSNAEPRIEIVSTLFPWYDLSQSIGGDRVETTLLLPPGVSPHAYEPTPSDMIKISQADIFVYTGKQLEPWADKLLTSLNESPHFLILGQDLNSLELLAHEDEAGHEEEGSYDNEQGLDPHVWLDPFLMIEAATRFAHELVEIDPTSADYYQANLERYKNSLRSLDQDFKDGLADCAKREIIYGGHYAFAYLANRYNLEYEAAQGFSPDAESSPARLSNLVKLLKEHETKYLFASKMENSQLAKTLAQEAQVEILSLHTIHNLSKDEHDRGLNYEDLMRLNLENLIIGLECHSL